MLFSKKYNRLLIKRLITSISPSYYLTLKHIKRTELMSEDELKSIQLQKLRGILIHAYNNVPYYRDSFKKAGLNPYSFLKLSDIQHYPFLDKEIYRSNIDRLIMNNIVKRFWPTVFTGGTTGTPLKLYRSFSDYGRERAYMEYSYRMVGMDPFSRTVHIRGKVDDTRGIYHTIGNFGNTLYLSSNNMNNDKLELYIQLMRDFQPVLLYTLPSIATIIAEYMDRNKIPPIASIKHAFLPSENIYDFQKMIIEKVFNCTIGTQFGHSEHAVFATCCTKSSLYHVLPQYGYTELIDEDGNQVKEEGELGEVVATSFTNRVSPLIRYRTGDYAVYTNEKCPCGRNYPMWKKIQGREQSVAIAKNNGRISVGPELLCTLHDKSYGKVKQFQIQQTKEGSLDIYVTTHNREDFTEAREFFERFFNHQFPGMFDINIIHRENREYMKGTEKHLYFIQCIEKL